MKPYFTKHDFRKFNIITIAYLCFLFAAIAHLIYSIVYFATGFNLLGVHSLLAIIMYIIIIFCFNEQRMRNSFILINIELLSFILLTALTFNWRFSFELYIFVIIPLIIISSSSHSTNKYNLKLALLQFIILCVFILTTKVYTTYFLEGSSPTLSPYQTKIYDALSIFNFGGSLICAFILLISFSYDLNIARDALMHASTHDPLTNLINRAGMNPHFEDALANSTNNSYDYSIIIADLDDFKQINDTYGHNAGDDVLKTVAKTFINIVDSNDYVCRWGGEEILVLTPHNIEHTRTLAENLRSTIEKTVIHSGNLNINITATFGISQFTKGLSLSDVISKADANLYIGKNSSKNCVII